MRKCEICCQYTYSINRYCEDCANHELVKLKHQLVEKEHEIKPLREQNERVLKKLELIVDYNQDLIKQLEEKDKKIAKLEQELANYKLCRCVDCTTEYEYLLEKNIEDLEKQINQTAIAELEQLKEFINNNSVVYDKNSHIIIAEYIISHIDYKIKILKGDQDEICKK